VSLYFFVPAIVWVKGMDVEPSDDYGETGLVFKVLGISVLMSESQPS
jgi:hypothetical protein